MHSIPNGEEETGHIPWYRRFFHRPRPHENAHNSTLGNLSDDVEEEEEEGDNQPISTGVVEARNLHKTYLLGLGRFVVLRKWCVAVFSYTTHFKWLLDDVEGVPALRGVNLQVNRGEFVIIVGKSGSGKSSLLNILGTVDSPTRGELQIGGLVFNEKTKDQTISQIRIQSIGFVFQTFNLIPGMTAAQNVELPLILKVC